MKSMLKLLAVLAGLAGGPLAVAQSTAFSYQGQLSDGGAAANGLYDISFAAYDAALAGNLVSLIETNAAIVVSNGVFTTSVDFGSAIFNGQDLWLEIAVSTNGADAFLTIAPRQLFTPVPYALYAKTAGSASTVASSTVAAPQLNTTANPTAGQVLGYDGAQLVWQDPVIGGSLGGWSLTGNLGTTAGLNFIGTADNVPLEFKVNGSRALRLEYGYDAGITSIAPNVIGGSPANVVSNGIFGALIAGGGVATYPNRVGGAYASVLGGIGNAANGYSATAMGNSTIARGDFSTAMGVGSHSYGYAATAMGYYSQANGDFSTVAGAQNIASGNESMVGGGAYNVASGFGSVVVGGGYDGSTPQGNAASGADSSIGGGLGNLASGGTAVVGGGIGNSASGNDSVSDVEFVLNSPFFYFFSGSPTVAGGHANTASASCAMVPGGAFNTAGGDFSLAAGFHANALHAGSFVWADDSSSASFSSTANNQFMIRAAGGVGIGSGTPPPGGLRVASGGLAVTGASSPHYPGAAGVFVEKGATEGAVYAYDYTANTTLPLALNSPGGNVGVGTVNPQYTLDVNGITRTHTIIITGGSDLAEPFKLGGEVAPGSVLVIDAEHPGELKLSTTAYDAHVAGIVSGANGIRPGIAMHQEGVTDGGQNVALSGRVYVLAEARSGAIKPGDLLTTSSTPGRAMKVADRARAQGAIIGKAMSALNDGTGMVLVLVTLQ